MRTIVNKDDAINKIHKANPNYTLLSDFNGWREDITRKCNICGDIRTVKARSLIEKNHGKIRICPVCAAKERAKQKCKTHNKFIEELVSINPNIDVLDEYVNSNTKLKCRCRIDGHIWEAKPHSLLQNHGCPECYKRISNQRTNDEFISEMKIKHPTIVPLSVFARTKDNIKVHCTVCDYEWETTPNVLLNRDGYGCPKCANHYKIPEQEIIERLKIANPNVEYIDGYKGIEYHANFKCKKCGNKWHTPMNSVLSGRGCPRCNLSHGALRIEQYLNNLSIDYETEYRFEDCKDTRSLPFDFYIKSKNICIEYDGEQHFMPVRCNKNITQEEMNEKFKSQQYRDKIKTEYCKNNNIKLIRIPYTDFDNIEKILNKYIA